MSSERTPDGEAAEHPDGTGSEPDNSSLASKLSKELSNWRRKRSAGRPARPNGDGSSFKSEPARTIKVRGHETLVIRKPKLAGKSPAAPTPDPESSD